MTGLSTAQINSLSTQAVKRAQATASRGAARLRSLFPDWKIKAEGSGASPVQAILDAARGQESDLIVVGAHGHSMIGRFLGSVSQLVLTQAPCSVRVGRATPEKGRNGIRVMIAFDASSGAELAAKAVGQRQWPQNTQFRVVSVLTRASIGTMRLRHYRLAAGEMMKAHARPFLSRFADVSFGISEGDPKHILVTQAERWKADCVFVGARSLMGARRFLLGGVSMAVAARAHCSVEVVRPKG